MASSLDIGTLSGRIELEDRLTSALKLAGNSVNEFGGQFGALGTQMLATAAGFFTAQAAIGVVSSALTITVDVLKEAATVIKDLAMEGAAVADVEENFNHLTESAGRLGSTLLGELKTGTHNTITDFELMKVVNQDLAAGMNLTDKQFRTVAEGAFALAQATGGDVKTALDTMNDAMLTGRTRALAMLTGKIDLAAAEEEFAKKMKTTVEHLTAEGKLQAAREAILNAVSEATGRLGEQTDGLDEKVAQAQTTWKNFQEELGKSIATSPVIIAALDGIRDALSEALGGSQEEVIKNLVSALEDIAITAIDVAKILVDVFQLALGATSEWLAELDRSIRAVELFLSVFMDTSAILKGINALSAVEVGLMKFNLALTAVNPALDKIQAGMIAAQKAAAEAKPPTEKLAEATDATAQASTAAAAASEKNAFVMKQTAEEAKKMAAAMTEIHSAGKSLKDTLAQIDPIILAQVETYLQAGVSQAALATAYSLTAAQVKAVADSLKEEAEALKIEQKQITDSQARWAEYHAMKIDLSSTATSKTISDIERWEAAQIRSHQNAKTDTADFYDWLVKEEALMYQKADLARLEGDVHSKAHFEKLARDAKDAYDFATSHADQFTSAWIADLKTSSDAAASAAASWKTSMGGAIDDTVGKIRTLSGEWMTLAQFVAKQNAPVSFTGDTVDQFTIDTTKGGADALLDELMYLSQHLNDPVTSFATQNLHFKNLARFNALRAAYQLLMSQSKRPHSPIPGLAEGGVGEFGEGTLVALHGREAIIPLNSPGAAGALGSNVVNNFYVNGTAADVARQISNEIMRGLKQARLYGAA